MRPMVAEDKIKQEDYRKTPAMDTLVDRLRDMLVKLEEITKCPVCLESVGTNAYQCLRGHALCSPCHQRLDECPLCKDALIIYKPQSLVQILELLPKVCKNNKHGCKEIYFAGDHKLYCEYRSIQCKFGHFNECRWVGQAKDLKSHVKKVHCGFNASYRCDSPTTLYFEKFNDSWQTKQYLHVVENHLFLLFAHKDLNSKRFFQLIKQIPLGGPNQEYYFKVRIGNQKYFFQHTIKACLTVDENEQLENNPYCMIVPLEEMDSFLNYRTGSLEVTCEAFKK